MIFKSEFKIIYGDFQQEKNSNCNGVILKMSNYKDELLIIYFVIEKTVHDGKRMNEHLSLDTTIKQ